MKSGKHILLLTPGFPANADDHLCIPPVQAFLHAYLQAYPDDRISVISFQYPYVSGPYTWEGVPVYSCGGANSRWRKYRVWKNAEKMFRHIHSTTPVDVIHSLWWGECARMGSNLAKACSLPHICTLMGQDVQADNRYLRQKEITASSTVALCTRHAAGYQETTGKKADSIIPWGIDPAEIPALSPIRDIDIIGVGSLIPLKQYELFIDAVAALASVHPALKAILIGYGPEEKKLKRKIAALGLQDHIAMPGLLPRPEVLHHFSRSRVLLHPSSFESYGYVYSEALACGAEIVSLPTGWAAPSPRWSVVDEQKEMIAALRQRLNQPGEHTPCIPFTAQDTARAYHQLYYGQ